MISHAHGRAPLPTCADFRTALEHRFDDESTTIATDTLDRHLEQCVECAAHEQDLQRVRGMLRCLPEARFPHDALDEVMRQTVDRPVVSSPFAFLRRQAVNLALAAVLTLAAIGAWFATNGGAMSPGHSEAELVRLERDLNEIMFRLSSTLRDTEEFAIHDVLIDEASPTLRNSPFESSHR